MLKQTYLSHDVAGIQAFLDEFDAPANGERREAAVMPSGEIVVVRNMPLPDGFNPDYVDLALYVPRYPGTPPIGLYVLRKNNAATIAQLKAIFNVLRAGHHEAPTVPNYDWICLAFADNRWSFNINSPNAGDNLRKFLIRFYNLCLTPGRS